MVKRTACLVISAMVFAGFACQSPFVRGVGASEEELFWLANALNDHVFGIEETAFATGISPDRIKGLLAREAIPKTGAWHDSDALKLLPYPGGRHPRIGFLEGAVDPMRGTKVSLFTPWNERSYIVIDVPEAIWSNLGLIWLAHTHIPTFWDEQGIVVEPFEWDRQSDGTMRFECCLPNDIRFGSLVRPAADGATMQMWFHNGTDAPLTGLHAQVCIMFKGAEGFRAQTNENKIYQKPVAVAKHSLRERYILTAWKPFHSVLGNELCPCLHSDPIFPDCAPGETVYSHGIVVFYEGQDLDGAVSRVKSRVEQL